MEKQNITLSIPKDILRRAKILAVEKETSLSGLLAQFLEDIVVGEQEYQGAKRKNLALLDDARELGTKGSASWSRESLHER
ncbi:MAG: DUF6364 family protein [Anaerolineaceae bacterium]|nr:DUF6364 family protein [Anaerolineaceae bacterium]